MVIRKYCSCETCDKKYVIRYGVGDSYPQQASFFCKNCGEKLVFGIDKERKFFNENLKIIEENTDSEVINLHPEILISNEDSSDPYHFATLNFMREQQLRGDFSLEQLRQAQYSILAYNEEWLKISKDLRFVKEKRFNLVNGKYGKNDNVITKRVIKKALLISRIFLSGPWKNLYSKSILELEKAEKVNGFSEFKDYLESNVDKFIDSLYDVMSDFEKVKSEMLTTLIPQKCGKPISGLTSTVEWDKIEKVYGDLYERYGGLVVVLTGINNLITRGKYDEFSTSGFTFTNYLQSDKANRCKNFETNANLSDFNLFFDASIRNGTHHKNSKIDKEKQEIILGTGKGGKTEKKLNFSEYIEHCNELFARSYMMLNLAFKIIYG